jgi:uncharacterized protein
MGENLSVAIQSEYILKGTLAIPEGQGGSYPAILIIPGTGKTNRDGNDKGISINIYKDLADFFTSLGFVTLRYDKRGTHESEGDYFATGVHDLIDDAVACVQFLQTNKHVDPDRIILVGHSEGALLAPAIHGKVKVSGLVLLAGAAEASKTLLPKQFDMVISEIEATKGFKGWLYRLLKVTRKAKKQNDAVFQKILNSSEAVMRIKGAKINAKWMREQMNYNVCEYLEKVEIPTLAITGDKDIQVPPDHAEKIAEMVQGDAAWHIVSDMNHILRKYPHNHTMLGLMKEYKKLFNDPIDSTLYRLLEDWLRERYIH